jgi:hypothetical protein
VLRGYYVDGLSGEQYALPEAIAALREAKVRQRPGGDREIDGPATGADLVCINAVDPANPFGFFFPLTDALGDKVRFTASPTKALILDCGRPVMLWEGRVQVLVDMTREATERAVRLLMDLVDDRLPYDTRSEIAIARWNGHPIDVSPARHLLLQLGFYLVDNRYRGCVYDGTNDQVVPAAPIPPLFEHARKEEAPVVYDAEWIISRATPLIRPKVRELIEWLMARLPPECEPIYRSHYGSDFMIRYRGMRCINPHVQKKKINLHITHSGWVRPIEIYPDTDLEDLAVANQIWGQFMRTRAAIDELLDQ